MIDEDEREALPIPVADPNHNTLDESIWRTVERDAHRILINTRCVLLPFGIRHDEKAKILRDWDLWGPLVYVLALGTCLISDVQEAPALFSTVFSTIVFGSVALTLNVLLLRGHIIFLQAISLTGYCIFPLNIAVLMMKIGLSRTYCTVLACSSVICSILASLPLVSAAVHEKRTGLAVFPVVLLHVSLAVLAVFSVQVR